MGGSTMPRKRDAAVTVTQTERGAVEKFKEGMQAPMQGLSVLRGQPGLWRYAIVPVLLNLLITLAILAGLVALAVWFAVKLHPVFEDTWTERLLEAATILLLAIVAVAGALGTWILLNGILCGHYYGKLAREVEVRLGTPSDALRDIPFRYQVIDTLRDLAAVIGINLMVLMLNVVPGLGTVIAFAVGAYFNGLLLGKDFLDFPLGLRGMRRAQKREVVARHRWETVGLGATAFVFKLVPVVGSIVAATAVVGAVVMHKRWEAEEGNAPS